MEAKITAQIHALAFTMSCINTFFLDSTTQHSSTYLVVHKFQSDVNGVIEFKKLKFVCFLPNWRRKDLKVVS